MIDVSVLLPVYNGEAFLKEAMASILNQTLINFELIVIDDGSTDQTAAIIKSFADNRIRSIRNSHNEGVIKVLNQGILLANGPYIARMDADDVSLATRLEKQFAYLKKHPEVVAVGCAIKILGEKDVIIYESDFKKLKSAMIFGNPCAHPGLMFRKSSVKRFMYKEAYPHAEDYRLVADLASIGPVVNLAEPLLHHRKHPGQVTANYQNKQKKTHTLISSEILLDEFGLKVNQEIFFKYFSNQALTFEEMIYLHKIFFSLSVMSLSKTNYSSVYFFFKWLKLNKHLFKRSTGT